jgi:hypothetical protein
MTETNYLQCKSFNTSECSEYGRLRARKKKHKLKRKLEHIVRNDIKCIDNEPRSPKEENFWLSFFLLSKNILQNDH